MNVSRHIAYGFILFFGLVTSSAGQPNMPPSRDITQTPHNLSVSGGGGAHDVKSTKESRICIFCHAPHHATSVTPLWSRDISPLTIYVPYKSSTIKANPQQPMGASRLCLSCHDGTIALGLLAGNYVLDPGLKAFKDMPSESDPAKNPNLGTDLSDDHPISFIYSYGTNMELNSPETLEARGIKLAQGEYVECTSCHDPHNSAGSNAMILRNADSSALCTNCHKVNGYSGYSTASISMHNGSKHSSSTICLDCHATHGSNNILLIRSKINGKTINFQNFSGTNNFVNAGGTGLCQVCHTATSHYKADGTGQDHNVGRNCTQCHTHGSGFSPFGSGGAGGCNVCHGFPPAPGNAGPFGWNDATGTRPTAPLSRFRPIAITSLTTALPVGMDPAPRPYSTTSPTASPTSWIALYTSST